MSSRIVEPFGVYIDEGDFCSCRVTFYSDMELEDQLLNDDTSEWGELFSDSTTVDAQLKKVS
ncbi:hypothetical protein Droror1_Dr00023099 [Drosera rotundifolia]